MTWRELKLFIDEKVVGNDWIDLQVALLDGEKNEFLEVSGCGTNSPLTSEDHYSQLAEHEPYLIF